MMRSGRLADLFLTPPSSDEEIRAQYGSLRPQVPTMYIALFVNILFLGTVAGRSLGDRAYVLPVMMGVAGVARLLAAWLVPAPVPSVAAMRRSMLISVILAAAISVVLAAWNQFIIRHGGPEARGYAALFAALCTISCAACLSSLPAAAYVVVAIGTVPVSVALIATGDVVLAAMGANLLLVAPLVVAMVRRQHGQLRLTVMAHGAMAAEKARTSELAYRDALTGLANRRAFHDALETALAGTPAARLAIAIIDLNGFKAINDTHGHQTGDALLVAVAGRFTRLVIGDALLARLGGDEFAILLRDVERPEDARVRLAGVAMVFERPFAIAGQHLALTASIGVAHAATATALLPDLIKCADLAMYDAKRRSTTTICLFEAEMATRSRRLIAIERALATDAESLLIDLCYQPVIDVATNRTVAFEALARWTHPTLGVISPAEFIPLAEQAGMVAPLTGHLLSLALGAAATWPREVGLAFNLSAGELTSPSLAPRILRLVAEHDFDPRRLSIEVTETALLSDFATARAVLGALRQGGVRILLDDFGAGYASIGYLREMQFDGIKLDGSLIAPVTESAASHDLLVGVLHLCRSIGAPVTAEMVETPAQHDLLHALGVDHVQGNFLSSPLTATEALARCIAERARGGAGDSSVVAFARRTGTAQPA